MSLARLVVTAVKIEGRTKASVARDYGIARSWVHELMRRYGCEGGAGLEPRSRRPHRSPHQVDRQLELVRGYGADHTVLAEGSEVDNQMQL